MWISIDTLRAAVPQLEAEVRVRPSHFKALKGKRNQLTYCIKKNPQI